MTMIFVTVGSQMPFDRLIRAVDLWAGHTRPDADIFAQIGDSAYRPAAMRYTRSLTPPEFAHTVAEADVIVAHAGMGSVLSGMERGKPLVLLPRRGDLQETRNDHQIATAHWLARRPGIFVAERDADLPAALAGAMAAAIMAANGGAAISPYASPDLLAAVRQFIVQVP
ncbi:MAG: glycosyl transferase family 28 [Burkholderiaceae bacterium]|nr:glycosyl transferase family 28 [Burkholderiaceae bacterium]